MELVVSCPDLSEGEERRSGHETTELDTLVALDTMSCGWLLAYQASS